MLPINREGALSACATGLPVTDLQGLLKDERGQKPVPVFVLGLAACLKCSVNLVSSAVLLITLGGGGDKSVLCNIETSSVFAFVGCWR